MTPNAIEPGQRLHMQIGGNSTFVSAISEAVTPAGYWLCHDESCGQKRVIAASVLSPIVLPPAADLAFSAAALAPALV